MNPTDILLTKVDELGLLLARISELTKQADAIKDELKEVRDEFATPRKTEIVDAEIEVEECAAPNGS